MGGKAALNRGSLWRRETAQQAWESFSAKSFAHKSVVTFFFFFQKPEEWGVQSLAPLTFWVR